MHIAFFAEYQLYQNAARSSHCGWGGGGGGGRGCPVHPPPGDGGGGLLNLVHGD